MREESPVQVRRGGTLYKTANTKKENNFIASPNKKTSTSRLSHKARKAILSPTKGGEVEDPKERDMYLQSPTSISMKKSFIISNADASFETYYQSQIKKKEKKMGQQLNEQMTTTQNNGSPGLGQNHFGAVAGIQPAARDGHSTVISANGFMFVFGGDRHHMPFNDLYLMEL